jgi:hypothetical protein
MFKSILLLCVAALTLAEECNGRFDVYFVFDRSASTQTNFQDHMVPFVKNVVSLPVSLPSLCPLSALLMPSRCSLDALPLPSDL